VCRVLGGQFRFLELLQDLVLLQPHRLDANPVFPEDTFIADWQVIILAGLKVSPGEVFLSSDCLRNLEPVRDMAYFHWVLSSYLFIPQCKAEAVFVIVRCPYKFLAKPVVIQECDCLALFQIPRQDEPMLCFWVLQVDFPLVPLLTS
jgi:hypothetical protein